MITPALLILASGSLIAADHVTGDRLTWLPVLATSLGMALSVAGSGIMLVECQLSTRQIRAEIAELN